LTADGGSRQGCYLGPPRRLLPALTLLALAAVPAAGATAQGLPPEPTVTAKAQSGGDIAVTITTNTAGVQIGCSGVLGTSDARYGPGVVVNPLPVGTTNIVIHPNARTRRTLRKRSLTVAINCRFSFPSSSEAGVTGPTIKVPRLR
jgi:hypothetical protein